MEIRALGPGDVDAVVGASDLFDQPPTREWAERFLGSPGHHLLFGFLDDEAVGFVSGVETVHPDKGTEMFLYELSVGEAYRRRGIGKALVSELAGLARSRGCYGMWVSTEPDNEAALATYRAAGAGDPDEFVVLTWDFESGGG